jgi:predicted O-methyltransferase YrrM
MNFSEFEQKIIPACRSKHLFLTNPKYYFKRLIRGRISNIGNKPYYFLGNSIIPNGFVRQEPWEMEYLFMLASMAKVGILETGRYNGGSALVHSCANSTVPIHSIDIAPKNDSSLLTLMMQLDVGSNCNLIVGDSQHTKYPEIGNLDLLFIDGDHSFKGCYSDLENWYGNVVPGGHIVLHDCYFESEVQAATIEFIKDKNVQIVASPYKIKNHFRYPEGSLCHFIKLA